jgi:hypothetical protein
MVFVDKSDPWEEREGFFLHLWTDCAGLFLLVTKTDIEGTAVLWPVSIWNCIPAYSTDETAYQRTVQYSRQILRSTAYGLMYFRTCKRDTSLRITQIRHFLLFGAFFLFW